MLIIHFFFQPSFLPLISHPWKSFRDFILLFIRKTLYFEDPSNISVSSMKTVWCLLRFRLISSKEFEIFVFYIKKTWRVSTKQHFSSVTPHIFLYISLIDENFSSSYLFNVSIIPQIYHEDFSAFLMVSVWFHQKIWMAFS